MPAIIYVKQVYFIYLCFFSLLLQIMGPATHMPVSLAVPGGSVVHGLLRVGHD